MKKAMRKNWGKINLESIVERMTNGSNLPQFENYFENSHPITRIETIANESFNLQKVKYVLADENQLEKYKLQSGDILFSHINSDKHLGKTAIYNSDKTIIHGINLLLIRCSKFYNPTLLNYFFKYYRLEGKFMEVAQRAVNQSSINQKKLNSFTFPLPPLSEQNRIAVKLDTIFLQLEKIKIGMKNVSILLKDFRQQIISQAITGRLTEEWRKEQELDNVRDILKTIEKNRKQNATKSQIEKLNEIYTDNSTTINFPLPNEWEEVNLDKICEKFTYGTSTKSDESGEYVVLRMGNLQNGKIDWTDLKFTSDSSEYNKYRLLKGDVLFNRTNSPELVGKTSIFDGKSEAIYAGYLIKIWNFKELNSEYLNYVMNSDFVKKWCWKVKSDGVSQSNINAQKLSKLTIPFPSHTEQKEIVLRIQSLFSKADIIEEQYNSLQKKIDNLPQALLHKAFKGELTQQLDNDDDVSELLKEIEAFKNNRIRSKK